MGIITKIIGSRNTRLLRRYRKIVYRINKLEPAMQALSDEALRNKTVELREKVVQGMELKALLPEAFAVVREAAWRSLKMRHFDVQLIGGMVLFDGKVAEMHTGEGKTLASTLPTYLHALTGKGVHLVTVNDYLVQRDADWMRPVYEFLGLRVAVNLSGMDPQAKQEAYAADITYGTNNEFGFDYLRDNMVFEPEQKVQRPLSYAIIDEVDSILIDEARTPLIISGQEEQSSDLYQKVDKIIPSLKRQMVEDDPLAEEPIADADKGDYYVDEKNRQVFLTDLGHHHVEQLLVKKGMMQEGHSLYDPSNITLMHYVNAALRAHSLFSLDVDYVVKDGEVVIVDEHTGRLMEGRRWSEGLHQAVEAKEGAKIQLENQTLATITFQNYFRLYAKLAGMTGTADTEAFELQKIYGLEVVVIPTHRPLIRDDAKDQVYMSHQGKLEAMLANLKCRHAKGQPVLVGTASIEMSEQLSQLLNKEKIQHEVLNAKNHSREATIIAQAGRFGAVTIATNMAGRGTDIVLGGNPDAIISALNNPTEEQVKKTQEEWKQNNQQVLSVGGLHVLGTERNESRRIDNQLRGRSGRQGDAGSSQFFLSMDDNLLRIFARDRVQGLISRLGVSESDVIEHSWLNKAIEKAQRRVEGMHFDIRKQLLEFDDVASDQRKVIYQQRDELIQAEDLNDTVTALRDEVVDEMVSRFMPSDTMEDEWDIKGLEQQLEQDFNVRLSIREWLEQDESMDSERVTARIVEALKSGYVDKISVLDDDTKQQLQKGVMLQILDMHWKDQLASMDHLRQAIHLQGYAQKNPTQEFKRESFEMFSKMMGAIQHDYISTLAKLELQSEQAANLPTPAMQINYQHDDFSAPSVSDQVPEMAHAVGDEGGEVLTFRRVQPKVGRNDPCPCGSGKKYKQCHGKIS